MKYPNNPFVFLHTHTLTEQLLEKVIDARVPIEIDVSINNDDVLYVGHPAEWYAFHGYEQSRNLIDFSLALEMLQSANLPFVVDLKDRDAYFPLKSMLQTVKNSDYMLHVFAEALAFDMLESVAEPHRIQENIPTELIIDAKRDLAIPIIASARGMELLHDEETIVEAMAPIAPWINAYNANAHESVYTPKLKEFFAANDIDLLRFAQTVKQLAGAKIAATDSLAVAAKANGTL